MISRAERSSFTEWWWTVDQMMIFAILLLICLGIVLGLAASPVVAERLGIENSYYFVVQQIKYSFLTLLTMLILSFLSPNQIKALSLIIFISGIMLMILVLFTSLEIKGSKRWLSILGYSLQPSEFVKPAFVIITAWLLSHGLSFKNFIIAFFGLTLVCSLLILQPDYGQTFLIAAVWCSLLFLSGLSIILLLILGVGMMSALTLAYYFEPHVASRIDRFLNPGSGDTFQVDRAIDSIIKGGWFGTGPGEGVVKRILPDPHTDFVFAVGGEEFGIYLCLIIVAFFAFIILRPMVRCYNFQDRFQRLAVFGLCILLGLQAFINMGVNLQLLPAKGMTLPFISYGGSSLLSMGIIAGFIIALMRTNPQQPR